MDLTDMKFNLGDLRLDKAARQMCEKIVDKKTAIIKILGDNAADQKKFYRLTNNDRVTPDKIFLPTIHKTSDICSEHEHVLLIQDTTDFRFEAVNKGSRPDIGLVGHDRSIGFRAHVNLALDASTGECLGLADVQMMRKTEKSDLTGYERNCQSIEEKTSYRWISSVYKTNDLIDEKTKKTYIGDRESDAFDFYNTCNIVGCDYVIRSSVDRNTNTEKEAKIVYRPTRQRIKQYFSLSELLDREEVFYVYEDLIPRISGVRKARQSRFQVKIIETEIRRTSRKGFSKDLPRFLPINCIEVKEINDDVAEPVHWRLLTSHKVENAEDCQKIIEYYKARWNIEQLFRSTKKKGLMVEENQSKTYESLANIAAFALISACHCMQLVKAMDIDSKSEPPVENVFDKESIPALDFLNKKYQGKTQKQMNLAPKGSLRWAAWIIARMGGWCGYISQGKPGPITMKRGLEQFATFQLGWLAARAT